MYIFSGGNRTVVFLRSERLSRGDLVPPDPWLAALLSALTSACPDTDIITTEIRQHQ